MLTANVEILIPPGASADLENPTAFLTSNNKLVVRGATGAAHNNQFEIKQDDLGNILLTDQQLAFGDIAGIPGAELSADGRTMKIPAGVITGQQIYIFGGDGDDTLTFDMTLGNPVPAGGLTFYGGAQNSTQPGDQIVLNGGWAENVDYEFINEHDGSITVDGRRINYEGLEPVTDNMDAANRSFTFTSGAETVTIADVAAAGLTRIDSNAGGELVDFAVPTNSLTVIVNGGDTVNITSFDATFNTPTISLQGTTSANAYNLGTGNVIPDATNVTLTGNADLNLNAANDETIGSLASTDAVPTVVLTGARTLTTGNAANTTFSGVISGSGGLTKVGAGTLSLTGLNTYTGVTAFSGGILNAATIADYGVASAVGARLAGAEAPTNIGFVFRGGTLQYTGATPQSTNRQIRVQAATGGTIEASGSVATATVSFTYSAANTDFFDTGGTRTLRLAGTNTGNNLFAHQIIDQAGNATSLTKTGAGTWFLTNNGSNYTGVTAFEGGILNVSSLADYGVASSVGARTAGQEVSTNIGFVFRGGTLQYTGATPQSTNRQIRVQATTGGTIDASGSFPAATLSFTYSAANTDFFDTGGTRTLRLGGTNTGNNVFAHQIIDQAGNATSLTKIGAGTWFVTNSASNYTGVTAMEGGILNASSFADYGVVSSLGARTAGQEVSTNIGFVFRGGTLQYTGSTPQSTNRQIRVQAVTGGTIEASGSVPTATLSFTYSAANTDFFDTGGTRTLRLGGTNTGNNVFAHQIIDQAGNATSLTKTGAGTWFLTSNASNYTGVTAFEGGILNVASIADYGMLSSLGARTAGQEAAGNIGLVFRSGTLQYTGASAQSTNRQIRVQNTGGTIDASGSVPAATLSFTFNTPNTDWFDTAGVRTFTLTGTNTGANTFANIIANQTPNATNLTKSGAGSWTLSGVNTYTGVTTISGGTLRNGSATTFTSLGALSMSGNGVFDLNGFNAGFTNVAASATTNTITNNGAAASFTESAQANTINALVTDGTGVMTFRLSNANSGVTPFLLTSTNTFSGGLVLLNSGAGTRLRITGPITTVGTPGAIVSSPFGRGAITIGTAATDRAQILFDTVANNTLVNNIIVNTAQGTDVFGAFRIDTGGHTFSGTITANLARAKFASGGTVTLTGQLTGPNGLDVLNSGGVTLNNQTASPNNYAGTTIVGIPGRLNLGANNQLPNGAGTGLTQIDGTLNLNGFSDTINGLAGQGIVDGISGTPTLTFGDNNSTGNDFGGVLRNTAGTLGITKIGTGVQTLSGTNTYGGATNINAGTLQTGVNVPITNFSFEAPAIGKDTNSYNNATATWTFLLNSGLINGNGGGFNPAGLVNGNQNGFVQILGNFSQSINFASAGTYTLRFLTEARGGGGNPFNVRLDGTIVAASVLPAASTSFNMVTIPGLVVTAGAHTLQFEGLEPVLDRTSFIDYVTISGSGSANAIPDTSVVTVAASAVLDLANSTETVGPLNGAAGSSVTMGTGSLTINSTAAATFSGVISGSGPVLKNNTSTQTLAGVNTYTGATTVAGGTLAVNGSIIPSATTVQSGATIAGTGTTGLLTVNAGGIQAPGTTIGKLTTSGNYIENGALQIQIGSPSGAVAGTDYDQVAIIGSGSVAIGAAATLAVSYTGVAGTFAPAGGQVYVLIDNDGTLPADTTGTFTGLPAGATVTVDGKALTIQYNGGDGNDVVLIAPASGLYVDDDFPASGPVADIDLETAGAQAGVMGTNAFQSVAAALTANPGYVGMIFVNGGTYATATLAGGGAVTLRLLQDLTNAGDLNVTFQSLTGDATDSIVTRALNAANANLIVESGSFAGVINGSGDVIKANTGTVTLTGANTYAGATIINGGVVSVADVTNTGVAGPLGSGSSVTISGNSVLQFTGAAADATNRTFNIAASSGANSPRIEVTNAAADLQITGTIAGAGQILGKLGAGALSLETGSTTTIGTLFLAGGVTNMRGSANVTAGQIAVGASPFFILGGSSGTLNIQGTATISTGTIHLGENNGGAAQTNVINQSGGTVTVTGNSGENAGIRLAHWGNETSTYNLSGGTLTLTDLTADIAIATDGTGTFNQTGGVLNVPGIVVDHRSANGAASLNLTGGTSTIGARGLRVADSTTAVIAGTASVTANSVAIGEFANSSLSIGGAANVNVTGAVTLGTAAAISGDLNVTSTGTITFGSLRVGRGTATITGANVTSTSVSIIGTNRLDEIPGMTAGSAATGVLNIGSGSFTAAGIVMGNANGGAVVGTVNQTGGTVTTTGDAGEGNGLRMGHWPTGTANYNLASGTLNVNGAFALSTATDGTGSFTQTGGVANVLQLDLNSRAAATGNGTFTLNGGTFNVGSGGIVTDGGGGPYTANLGGGILRATANWSSSLNFNLTNAIGPAIVDTNGFNITLSGVLSGSGGLTKSTGLGNLTLSGANTYSGATNVNAGVLQLTGGAAIVDSGVVNVGLGGTLQLLASETIASFVGAGDGVGSNDSTLALGAFTLTTSGSAAVANATSSGGAIAAGAAITDADDDNNVTGTSIVLTAASGIGTAVDPLETTLGNLEAEGGSGGVFIANTGNLILGGLGALVGVSATGGNVNVSSAGSLTVSENVTASGGDVVLATLDAGTTGQDLIVSATATVSSTAGTVTLSAGDNATISGNLSSGTSTTVNVDATNADAIGGVFSLTGTITAPSGAFLNGDTNNDTFNLAPQTAAAVTVNGQAPHLTLTGDVLNLNLTSAVNQQLALGSIGSGTWTFAAPLQTVNYISIEEMNANQPYHLSLDANTSSFGNTNVPDLITVRMNGANLVVERTGSALAPDDDDVGVIFQGAIAQIQSFTYIGSADDDTLTISDVGGLPQFGSTVPSIPDNANIAGVGSILLDGNGGADSLVFNLTGANAALTYAIGNGTGAAGNEGEVLVASGALALQAYFVETELAERTGTGATPGALSIIGDSAVNNIAITANGANSVVSATGYTPLSFSGNNFTSLSIDALGSGDRLALVSFGTGQTNNPTVTLNGSAGDDTLQVHSTSGNTGSVTLNGGVGNDAFVLQSATSTVDGIVGRVIVDGTDGIIANNSDTLTIIDSGDATGDSVFINAVNSATSSDYRVEGISTTGGDDVIFRNIDTLTYTGTAGNDTIDAQFVNTTPAHDLAVATLNGWLGGDQFLLFTSDQVGGTSPTPTGVPSGLAVIALNGDAAGNPNALDGNDIFGATAPGIVGTGAGNAGLAVANTVRGIRPSVSTGIAIDGGQPTAPVGTMGDIIGDTLNLDLSGVSLASSFVLATLSGVIASPGLQPLNYTQIEDLNFISNNQLVNLQLGDTLVRGTSGPDTIIFSRNPTPTDPSGTRVRLNTTFVDFPMSGKTLTYAGASNDYVTHSNVTFPVEIHGEGGDDYIAGGMGNDLIYGGLGSDQVNASGGDNIVWGDDAPSGAQPLPQNSALGGDDILSALGGNDVFYGGGGNDLVSPGAGNDYLHGGEGDDMLDGAQGDDRLYGGGGNDVLSGSAGNDLLSGGGGNDLLLGSEGNDVLIGGGGADNINAGEGDDLIISGSVANESSSWTSQPVTTTFGAGIYSRPTDNDAALLLLLTQWSSSGDRSSLAAISSDGIFDTVWGYTGNDDFSTSAGETQDLNASGMGSDELF